MCITFTNSWSFLLLLRCSGSGGSNKTHCPAESRSAGKGLVSDVGCVELVTRTVDWRPSLSHLQEGENRGMVTSILRLEENRFLKVFYSIRRCGSKTRDF